MSHQHCCKRARIREVYNQLREGSKRKLKLCKACKLKLSPIKKLHKAEAQKSIDGFLLEMKEIFNCQKFSLNAKNFAKMHKYGTKRKEMKTKPQG